MKKTGIALKEELHTTKEPEKFNIAHWMSR
jgi:hypothetical protein